MTTKSIANNTYYTRKLDANNTQILPALYDRYQADYDYNGALDAEGDSADYYRLVKVVRIG